MTTRPQKILMTPIGSAGDVHPYVGLGRAMARRGHEVTIITSGKFADVVRRAGLGFFEVGTAEQFEINLQDPDLWHPTRGFGTVMGFVMDAMPELFAALQKLHEPGRTILVGHPIAFATRVFEDKFDVPSATVHIAPVALRSEIGPPVMRPGVDIARWPTWLKRALWWGVDRFWLDRIIKKPINKLRREHDLPPVDRIFQRWVNSPRMVLGLFPDWFGPPQPDWPPNTHSSGFPLWDESGQHGLGADLEQFLGEGERPLAFTPGSAMLHGREFFTEAIAAAKLLDRRALVCTQYPQQLPTGLPPTVKHVRYAPYSELFPRCAAVIHHGGIGTCGQGLAAGVPQLIMPMSHDQPDNATRLKRLRVGDWLVPQKFTGPRIAEKLDFLLRSPATTVACFECAQKVRSSTGMQTACDLLESLAAPRPTPTIRI
jgi:rhamnosyltransferase subunit B